MSKEIAISYTFSYVKGNVNEKIQKTNKQTDVAASVPRFGGQIQAIGISAHEALVIPSDIGTLGYMLLENHDETNYVEIGYDLSAAFVPILRLDPGDQLIVKWAIAAPYAKANTGAVDLEYKAFSR